MDKVVRMTIFNKVSFFPHPAQSQLLLTQTVKSTLDFYIITEASVNSTNTTNDVIVIKLYHGP